MKLQSDIFQMENEIQWEDLGNGIQRQVFGYDDRVMLVKAKFETGAVENFINTTIRKSPM